MVEPMTNVTDADLAEAFKLHPPGEVDPLIVAALVGKLRIAEEEAARLRQILAPQWFYADGYESDGCHDSPDEVIEALDLKPGRHVVQIDCATPLPSIWCAVHVRTNDEMESLDTDDRTAFTEHASEADAAALTQIKD